MGAQERFGLLQCRLVVSVKRMVRGITVIILLAVIVQAHAEAEVFDERERPAGDNDEVEEKVLLERSASAGRREAADLEMTALAKKLKGGPKRYDPLEQHDHIWPEENLTGWDRKMISTSYTIPGY